MIKPYVISLDDVKKYLKITDTTYDVDIEMYLPVVTDDIIRVNGICNQSFLISGFADTLSSNVLSNVGLTATEWDNLYVGSCVYINGEDGVISDYDKDNQTITLQSVLTKTDTEQILYIRNFPIGSKAILSQMVFYKIDSSTIDGDYGKDISSKSIGPVSTQYVTGVTISSALDSRFGYPRDLIKSLATIRKPRFY